MNQRTAVLLILDGFGVNPDSQHNAVKQAKMPHYQKLLAHYPHTELQASESFVGLPGGFMGNSEVGHLNIGAGRIVFQDFSLISRAIEDGDFFTNTAFMVLMEKIKARPGAALHVMGLLSDGGVHSHYTHLFALLQMAKSKGISQVWVHAFMDGRDTSPTSGKDYLKKTVEVCGELGIAKVATVSGRFYAMDRDSRWERTELAYNAIVLNKSKNLYDDPEKYLLKSYESQTTDEFVLPGVWKGYPGVKEGDGVIFYNFRADRARQITRAMTSPEFTQFRREIDPALSGFVCMTPYDASFKLSSAFEKTKVRNTLGEIISALAGKQLRIAETEKYAHVTYFFNGGEEKVFPGEKRILVPSPREVKTYDLKPEMSVYEVTDKLLAELNSDHYTLVVANFANPDMVGHTGNLPAAIRALESVDVCLGKIMAWVESHDAFLVLTADHGNCEMMQDRNGAPLTAHTLLPVPFVVADPKTPKRVLHSDGRLCDIAPTLLTLLGVEIPAEMTGKSLI